MTERLMLKAVEQFQKEFELAQEAFERDGRALERRANSTIMSLNQMNVAYDMIHEGARITAEFFASCEMIVLSLDEVCRPLLDQKPGIKAVKAVVDLIEKVNDAVADTNTSYTVSLNGSAKSDVGSLQPLSSMQSMVIQKFWESHYRRMPEYAAAQKEEAAKQEKLKKTAKSPKDKIRAQEKKNEEVRALANERSNEHMERVEQFKKDLDAKLLKITNQRKREIAAERRELQSTLVEKQRVLDKLGFFHFSEKKALRQQIASLEIQIARTSAPQYGMEVIEEQTQKTKKAVSEYQRKVKEFCDKFLSVKTEEIAIQRAEPIPLRRDCSKDEKAILNTMVEHAVYTASDLVILVDSPSLPNTQRMASVLNGLVCKGHVEKDYDKGISVYRLAGKERRVSYEIVTLDRKQMESPCPNPPSVESILK